MDVRGSEVRITLGVDADFLSQSFELSAADVGEILSRVTRRRALIEEDGDLELPADALA